MNKLQLNKLKLVSKKGVIPGLTNTGLIRDNRIYSTNLDITISYPINITGTGNIELSILENPFFHGLIDHETITLNHGSSKATFPVSTENEFPELPICEIPKGTFRDVLEVNRLKNFTSKERTNFALNNIYIDDENICATSGSILRWIKKRSSVSNMYITSDVIPFLSDHYNVFTDTELLPNFIKLTGFGGEEIIFRSNNQPYIKYRDVIPEMKPVKFTINTTYVLNAIAETMRFGNESNKRLHILLMDNIIRLTTENIETSFHSASEHFVLRDGYMGNFEIGVNALLLKKIAEIYTKQWLTFEMFQSYRPIIINERNLIMPVMMSDGYHQKTNYDQAVVQFYTPDEEVKIEPEATNRKKSKKSKKAA